MHSEGKPIVKNATFDHSHGAAPEPSVARGFLLQRKCACGNHTTNGTCDECAHKESSLQRKTNNHGEPSRAPSIVNEVLRSPGNALDTSTREFFESRFDHDFSGVRVHADSNAAQSAEAVNALAYTVGHHIVFGTHQYFPQTPSGRNLLGHELTHVMQQGARAPSGDIAIGAVDSPEEMEADRVGGRMGTLADQTGRPATVDSGPTLRTAPKKGTPAKNAPTKPKVPMECGRPSRKVAGNSITRVNLDVGAHTLTIEWKDPAKAPALSAGSHDISPGAGLCCVNCDDETVSQTPNTLCTPKGSSWPVDRVGCALGGHPNAKNPTYFQRASIAIHSGNTLSPPQSHGCARTAPSISELIHDNVVVGTTQIASSGTWTSPRCYKTEAAETPVLRTDVCDGFKLKRKKKKAAPKGKPPNAPQETPSPTPKEPLPATPAQPPAAKNVPVAALEPESDVDEQLGYVPDGPGPNNAAASDESTHYMAGEGSDTGDLSAIA